MLNQSYFHTMKFNLEDYDLGDLGLGEFILGDFNLGDSDLIPGSTGRSVFSPYSPKVASGFRKRSAQRRPKCH